ncbi:MAG: IMP dehydrogenase [Candidatus Peribacteraceae bacterium]|jgi:IMP dehydrogenase|nr:IMP dehydrogenase [Candidatus Peribacteraceae bacterium]MDP7454832.1 IMP dehydrogenase [Candidatus Peribacteraceae bacterium]MDP7646023.1 IMP dehydrogenase [Candidatus Peribacteraceae bacterium]
MPKLLFESGDENLAYEDVTLRPYNSYEDRVRDLASTSQWESVGILHWQATESEGLIDVESTDKETLARLQQSALESAAEYRRALKALGNELGVPDSLSRDDVNFRPPDEYGNTPIAISNMNKVTGERQAEAAARMGANAVLPQDLTDKQMRRTSKFLHSRNPDYETAVWSKGNARLGEIQHWAQKRGARAVAVVGKQKKYKGVVNLDEVPGGINEDQRASGLMRTDWPTAGTEMSVREATEIMDRRRLSMLPVIDDEEKLVGAFTMNTPMRLRYQPHIHPKTGGLAMTAAIGAFNNDPVERAKLLIDLQVRGIVLDAAHIDNGMIAYDNIEKVRDLIEQRAKGLVTLIVGNVVTKEGTKNILASGADIVKVGLGPGAMCSTRIMAGVGVPQFSAVMECAKEARKYGKHIWADGGIEHPRDAALALAAGASQVMLGTEFTATHESPPRWQTRDDGRLYIESAGMASRMEATLRANGGKGKESDIELFRRIVGSRSEGVSGVPIFPKEGRMSTADIIHHYVDGITSGVTYSGAMTIDEMYRFARIILQRPSGYVEGKPMQI